MKHDSDIRVRVTEIETVAARIKRFRLVPADGATLPRFAGGAHVTVAIEDGATVLRNPYSLSGALDARDHYDITVLRTEESRGGSAFLHEKLVIGDELWISAPINLFPIVIRGRRHLLVAGGIGITPFLPMMEQLTRLSAPFDLHYAMTDVSSGAYAEMLRERYGARVKLYRSRDGQRIDLTALLQGQFLGTHLYVCGPERLIDSALAAAESLGWPEQNIHVERFSAPPPGNAFTVKLARSGITLAVEPNRSLLEAIEAAGVEPPYLCRGGACGQCETAVLSADGKLLHYDHYLSDERRAAGRSIMTCVSRFRGTELVLDL